MRLKSIASACVALCAAINVPLAAASPATETLTDVFQGKNVALETGYDILPMDLGAAISDFVTPASGEVESSILGFINGSQNYSVIQPGMEFYTVDNSLCTLGFQLSQNDRTFLTAGHCGTSGRIMATLDGVTKEVGTIVKGDKTPGTDFGVTNDTATIKIDAGIPISGAIIGEDKVPSSTISLRELANSGYTVCKSGSRSGKTCGSFAGSKGRHMLAELYSTGGDSGAPIYAIRGDGSIARVSILLGQGVRYPSTTVGQLVDQAAQQA